jgi:hypothetical protein
VKYTRIPSNKPNHFRRRCFVSLSRGIKRNGMFQIYQNYYRLSRFFSRIGIFFYCRLITQGRVDLPGVVTKSPSIVAGVVNECIYSVYNYDVISIGLSPSRLFPSGVSANRVRLRDFFQKLRSRPSTKEEPGPGCRPRRVGGARWGPLSSKSAPSAQGCQQF